jgi:hypothetical protein
MIVPPMMLAGGFQVFHVRSLTKGLWTELTQVTGTTVPYKYGFLPCLQNSTSW